MRMRLLESKGRMDQLTEQSRVFAGFEIGDGLIDDVAHFAPAFKAIGADLIGREGGE